MSTLQTLLATVSDQSARSVRVCMPATVESFDGPSQTCSAKPSLTELASDGSRTTLPVVTGIPVMFPGSASFGLTFPLAKGDNVLLVFADSCIDGWYAGVSNTNTRTHHLSDCYAIPGGRTTASKLSEFKTDSTVLGKQGDTGVRVSAGKVELGVTHSESATEASVLGNAQRTAFDSFVNSLKTALNTVLATGSNGGGPVVFAGLVALGVAIDAAKSTYDSAQFLSTKVKVK